MSTLKFAFTSLANAARNLNTPIRLGLRIDALIQAFINLKEDQGIDLFLLTEARIVDNAYKTDTMDAWDIAYEIAKALGMVSVVVPNQGMNKMALSKIAIYNPEKLYLLGTKNYYPGESVDLPSGFQFCQCITGLKFHRILSDTYDARGQCKNDSSLLLNIGFVHAPVGKEGRDHYFKMMVDQFSNSEESWIFPGDYSLFNENSAEQRELLDSNFIDMSSDLGVTFVSYPHDLDPNGNPYMSCLDKVYINKKFSEEFGTNIKTSAEQVECEGMRISEHAVITTEVDFS